MHETNAVNSSHKHFFFLYSKCQETQYVNYFRPGLEILTIVSVLLTDTANVDFNHWFKSRFKLVFLIKFNDSDQN